MKREMECPSCGREVFVRQTPNVTVDIVIENRSPNSRGEIVLIRRRSGAKLWAIPGGYVDYGETLEQAAVREAEEARFFLPGNFPLPLAFDHERILEDYFAKRY